MLTLPTTEGWLVEWETGKEMKVLHGKVVKERKSYETTDYQKALDMKAYLEKEGFANVKIYEAVF